MIATVEDGCLTALRPNPDHVVSRGYSCPKGLHYKEIVHSPDRVRSPMKRKGLVTGADSWTTLNWDNAFGEIGGKLKTIIQESGPDSVAMYVGNGAGFAFLHPFWAQGFLTGIGSTSLYGSATQDCSNKFAAARHMYGFPMLQPVPDFENSRLFIVFGGNPAATKLSFRGVPDPQGAFRKAAESGCRIVHINPRKTESVDAGGEHLAIRPDTDVFFLLSFVRELFINGGVDHQRSESFMKGRERLEEASRPWTPERQAEVTGIPADVLRSLAAAHRDADGAALYLSTGLNMGRSGTLCGWLVEAINAVSGNLDRVGGTLVGRGALMDFPRLGARAGVMMSDRTSRLGGFKAVNELLPGAMLADEILTDGPGRIRALLVAAGNPLLTLPDTAKTERALRALDLLVTVDIFQSPTSDFAHYVLPGVTPYEHPDIGYIFHSLMGIGHRRFLQYTDTVVPPVGDSRDEPWIWQNLCRAAGGKFFGSGLIQGHINLRTRLSALPGALGRLFSYSHERILDRFLRYSGKPGVRRMRQKPDGLLLSEPRAGSFLGKRVRTDDGLVNLAPAPFLEAMAGLDDQFEWEKDNLHRLKLVNMRGFRTHNSFLQSSPSLMKGAHNTNHLHIHPEDAATRGLIDGEAALVWSRSGCIRIPVKVSDRMSPGSAAIPFGWGQQRARGLETASRTGGANVNWLFPSGENHLERLSLMAHLSGLPIEASPAPKGVPAVVLAGGMSRRFGSDKAMAKLRGRRLIDHVMTAAAEICGDVVLSVSSSRGYDEFTMPRLIDPNPQLRTPLNGLIAAARVLDGHFVVFASDTPGIEPDLVRAMEAMASMGEGPIVIGDDDTLYPFPGVYHSRHLDMFEQAMERGEYRITHILRGMNPIIMSLEEAGSHDPDLSTLVNLNTPELLEKWDELSSADKVY
jgi:anaerobic selenocysteine-containing dehydrogenase/molybdopterin-guanine dinucleotide biosynthesis protein A